MRIIAIEGTRAEYERLKLLDQAPDYGIELPAQATAPFTVRWDPSLGTASVCIARTRIAHIHIPRKTPELHIEDVYPQAHDHLLIRALRNATQVTDQIGRLIKAETVSRGPLFSNTFEEVRVEMSLPRFMAAMLGAETLDPRLRVAHSKRHTEGVDIDAHIGNALHQFSFERDGAHMVSRRVPMSAYAMKAAPFTTLLTKGARIWDAKAGPDALQDAIARVPDISAINIAQIREQHETLCGIKALPHPEAVATHGALSMSAFMKKDVYWNITSDLRLNGVRIMTLQAYRSDPQREILTPDVLTPPDLDRLRHAFTAMQVAWQARTLGGELTDYPRIRTEDIETAIADTDFGYDL